MRCWPGRRGSPRTSSARTAGAVSPTSSTRMSSARSSSLDSSARTRSREPPPGSGTSASWRDHLAPHGGRLRGAWLARASAPAGAARRTQAHVAGRRRTSGAAIDAGVWASRTASAGRPTTRCDGRQPWRRLAKRTVEEWVGDAGGVVRARIAMRIRSVPASSRLTIPCRSSSVANRCPPRAWRPLRELQRAEEVSQRRRNTGVLRRERRRTIEIRVRDLEHADTRDAVAEIDDRDELERAFRRLSVDQRSVLVLHHYLGLSSSEIARTLGLRQGTVHSRLHYATSALRALLEADARPGLAVDGGRTA